MKAFRRMVAVAVAPVLLLLFWTTGAHAAYPPSGPRITVNKPVAKEGTEFIVKGFNFKPNSPVKVTLHSSTLLLGTPTSDGNGDFTLPTSAPCGFQTGLHVITGDDGTSTASTNITLTPCDGSVTDITPAVTSSAPLTSAPTSTSNPPSSNNNLPMTGVVIGTLLLVALLALVVGTVLVRRGRRHSY